MAKIIYDLKKINQVVQSINPHITVTNMPFPSVIECHCSLCNGTYMQSKYNAIHGAGCPICSGKVVIEGINDLKTTAPEIASFFLDDEFIRTHTKSSNIKSKVRCPICGHESMKSPNSIRKNMAFCSKCGDGISYPNKFIREVLTYLPIEKYDYEYNPDWAKLFFYDNYFVYQGKEYLLEVDGGFHYEDSRKATKFFTETYKDTNRRDLEKNRLAKEHHIEMIRIDARNSDPDYLKNSCLNSKLNEIFDLSVVDWAECHKRSLENKVKQACELYEKGIPIKEIAEELQVSLCSAYNYVRKGALIGLCSYGAEEDKETKETKSTIRVYKDKELILVGKNSKDVAFKMCKLNPEIRFSGDSILHAMKDNKLYKGFYFINNKRIKEGQVNLAEMEGGIN